MSVSPPATFAEALADKDLRNRLSKAGYTLYTLRLFYQADKSEQTEVYRFKVNLKATDLNFAAQVLGHVWLAGEYRWRAAGYEVVGAEINMIVETPTGEELGFSESGYYPPLRELERLVPQVDHLATVKFHERDWIAS